MNLDEEILQALQAHHYYEEWMATFAEAVAVSAPELEEAVPVMWICSAVGAVALFGSNVVETHELGMNISYYDMHYKTAIGFFAKHTTIPTLADP